MKSTIKWRKALNDRTTGDSQLHHIKSVYRLTVRKKKCVQREVVRIRSISNKYFKDPQLC